jgi:integrase
MGRLTKRTLESAEVKAKDYFIFDDELPGFGIRVMPSGRKIFVLQYRVGIKARRCTIGHFPVLTVEQARSKATKLLASVRDGQDPSGEKQMLAQAPTVRDLAKRYLDEHCAQHVKPSTYRNYNFILNRYILPEFGHLKVTDVTRAHIANLHHAMSNRPTNANRMLEVASKMFNLAELWGWRNDGTNPRRHIKKFKESKRERFLSPEETRRLGETLHMAQEANLCSPYAVAAFRLLILTGARLGEIQFCKWEYVHLDRGIIRLPDSKTGPKLIHLGRSAIDLLRDLPRKDGNPYLICSDHKLDEPINDLQTTWQKIRKWAGIEDVHIHDLRHTFASNAVAMGMSLPMIGKLLGHTQTQTTARYAHLALDPVLEAASKVTGELGGLLALPPPSDPITIEVQVKPVEVSALANALAIDDASDLPRFMTPKQAASYLNINSRLLENWRWKKCGPRFVKVGNSVRYTREDLDSYIQPSAA